NFARPGREARHNVIYWENGEWIGLGPGAHGQWAGRRMANVRPPDQYARALPGEGRLPIEWEETLSLRVQMGDTLMLGLRLRRGEAGRVPPALRGGRARRLRRRLALERGAGARGDGGRAPAAHPA